MKEKIQYVVTTLKSVLQNEPWYGQSVMKILRDVDRDLVYKKPNETSHSLIELLYHMNTWAEFTLNQNGEKQKRKFCRF